MQEPTQPDPQDAPADGTTDALAERSPRQAQTQGQIQALGRPGAVRPEASGSATVFDPHRHFHPAVATWLQATFGEATRCQALAWPAIQAGHNTLIAAPTGSGKTLAAFLAAIDALVRDDLAGRLGDGVQILYVSPLRALSNDVQRNLERPLTGIADALTGLGLPGHSIRTMVRTGDTEAQAREAMRRRPPHILVTTPESLFILLTSDSGRRALANVRTVIVDEIHALAPNKRGAHLSLSLERLRVLTARPPQRIGLSATQRPIDQVAHFLVGAGHPAADTQDHADLPDTAPDCTIIDQGHDRRRDIALVLPDSPLEALMSGEVWSEVYDRLCTAIESHRTTLVFVNTRRMAERVARALSERLGEPGGELGGEDIVTSHHGSMSKAQRHGAEQRLKAGKLKALVATASLELGIDIGEVDLVCQLGSPRAISTFLQRVGRSGHAIDGTPRGRLFPLTRDDLVECTALLDAVDRGELDSLRIPTQPLDVLAQQLVAMCACEPWAETELYAKVRAAWPYRALRLEQFKAVMRMLAQGYSTRRGPRGAYLHRDVVNEIARARRGARLTCLTNGGAIPDNADFDVILEPDGLMIGTLNEDFAIESMPGDIFQLGNSSWRVLRVESGKVRVEDARGLPPNLPFWLGEAPGRSDELSGSVHRLLAEVDRTLAVTGSTHHSRVLDQDRHDSTAHEPALRGADALSTLQARLRALCGTDSAVQQLLEYLSAAHAALSRLPGPDTVVIERFFDDSGGMQLVIHSGLGSRINRAWGLALRKRFCRAFNFELQAAANEDSIVLSLGETHSFALTDIAGFLNARNVRDVLVQALLDAPVFEVRWRWNANISLAVPRFRGGSKVPPHI
ncbi:MAG: DEAD/DEAH box helicase, partial [Gammaproteobacteria bacterium]|nr:DEAD/DEAH box helicase [Gammaproteobacteria bacterium]